MHPQKTAIQHLSASRQALHDALHAAGKKQKARKLPKAQPVVRKNTASPEPAAPSHLKNVQHMRAVLGAWLLRRWMKQPAHMVAAAITPALQRGIRKRPLPVLGVAALAGAAVVAIQVWRAKTAHKNFKRQ